MPRNRSIMYLAEIAAAALLVSCGGGSDMAGPATVGGVVAGLLSGRSVVLQNNGLNNTTVTANGSFSFSTALALNSQYSVTVLTQPPGQNCVVVNGSGMVAATVSNVAVNCTALPYGVGVKVTGIADVTGLVLQDNASDNLTLTASGSSTFATPVLSGAPYAVTVLTQPAGVNCLVQNGSGVIQTANVEVVVICPWHIGYAPASDGVDAWYLDEATGATTALAGSPFAAGMNPTAMALTPDGAFTYVVNHDDDTVSAFTVDARGALTAVTGSPFSVGMAPVGIVVHASAKFLYVANSGSNTLSGFSIDAATGALAPLLGSPFAAGGSPLFIQADSSGNFVYAALAAAGSPPLANVSGFSVDGTSGALTPLAGSPFLFPAGTPNSPQGFAGDPTGNFLYVIHAGIYADAIDPLTGALTPVAGSPFSGAVVSANWLAIDPAGKFLYDGGVFPTSPTDIVDEWTIDSSTGALARTTAPTLYTQGPPFAAGIDPSSRYLYFHCPIDARISCSSPASIDPVTGALTPATTAATGVPVVFK